MPEVAPALGAALKAHRAAAFGRRRLLRIRGGGTQASPPRLAGVTRAQYLLLGAKISRKRVEPRFRHPACQPGNDTRRNIPASSYPGTTGDHVLRARQWNTTCRRTGVRYRPPGRMRHTVASMSLTAASRRTDGPYGLDLYSAGLLLMDT